MTKRIYVAYTGGTIGMKPTDSGYAPADNFMSLLDEKLPVRVRGQLPAFDMAEYESLIDSSNITPKNWQQMAADIAGRYHDYDGFVVLHGTDTMAYSASMMSFMLRQPDKPVIFTGSQIPLCQPRTDALDNFVGALTIASDQRIREVCLFFNGRLMRGNRTCKQNAYLFDTFDSPNYPWLGRSDINIEVSEPLLWRPEGSPEFLLNCDTVAHVGVIQLFPGMTADWLTCILEQPTQAFILRTYGTGNGPDANKPFLNALHKATDTAKVIVNLTQCQKGAVLQGNYTAGSALAEAGVIGGGDTTTEAMFCKLHHLMSNGISTEQIREQVQQSLAGEITL